MVPDVVIKTKAGNPVTGDPGFENYFGSAL